MQVARIGFTPVKGGRHRTHVSVELTHAGPVGDRVFCLVDPSTGHCLRTVENPTLLQAGAAWDGTTLSVELPSGAAVGEPASTGEVITVDYWGRSAPVEVVAGPWAAAYSAHLDREVVLARSASGDMVYGASVSLVTGASLDWLADQAGAPVEGARFRATLQLDGDDLQPHDVAGWVGRRLRVGAAEVRVRSIIPRCAVVELDPASGVPDLRLLKVLASRRTRGEVPFGVDAEVTVPGRVTTGDAAGLARD